MHVRLNGELLGALIKTRGGVGTFLGQWSSSPTSSVDIPDRTTVYRWIKGETVPQSQELFLGAAGALDVDPFALLAVPVGNVLDAADEVLRMVQSSHPGYAFLRFAHSFFGRQINWPPDDIASRYFQRSWHVQPFEHDPKCRANFYAEVVLECSSEVPSKVPLVFHFAFRHPTLFRARWLQYGLVRVHGTSVVLHHINGQTDKLELSSADAPIRVETWFGPGPALFRIASLHAFSHTVTTLNESTGKAVRFLG